MTSWDRQRSDDGELEPIRWFGRFTRHYLSQGTERSLLAAYNGWRIEKHSKASTGTPLCWQKNAERWHWKQRAEAWDEEERRKRTKIEDEERQDMYHRHIRNAIVMQNISGARLVQLRDEPEALTPSDARQYMKDGIEIERTARGLPKEFLEILGMDDDQLMAYYRQRYADEDADGNGDTAAGIEPADDLP